MLAIVSALSSWTQVVIWLNWMGAFFALTVNYLAAKAAHKQTIGRRVGFWLYSVLAGAALVYVCAFAVLIIGPWGIATWSTVMSYVSLLVWPVVWSSPAILRTAARQSVMDIAASQVASVAEKRKGELC